MKGNHLFKYRDFLLIIHFLKIMNCLSVCVFDLQFTLFLIFFVISQFLFLFLFGFYSRVLSCLKNKIKIQ